MASTKRWGWAGVTSSDEPLQRSTRTIWSVRETYRCSHPARRVHRKPNPPRKPPAPTRRLGPQRLRSTLRSTMVAAVMLSRLKRIVRAGNVSVRPAVSTMNMRGRKRLQMQHPTTSRTAVVMPKEALAVGVDPARMTKMSGMEVRTYVSRRICVSMGARGNRCSR